MVADDKALDVTDKAVGRRGLCGTLMVHKIAGALADDGRSLDEIVKELDRVVAGLATIGLCLSPCSLPGRGPSFLLGDDEMELGLGIHGEAGVKRLPLASAKRTVEMMIDHLARKLESESTFGISPGDRLAIVVNNLGGTSCLELNIVVKETVCLLRSKSAVVERIFSGSLMTSLEMAGVSITLMRVDDSLLKCLDAPTSAPAWPNILSNRSVGVSGDCPLDSEILVDPTTPVADPTFDVVSKSLENGKASLNERYTAMVKKSIQNICATLIDNEEHLNDLDSESGDGDCGTTHSRMAKAILAALSRMSYSRPSALLVQLGHLAQEAMGGSSGAVYSIGFMAGAKYLEADVGVSSWARSLDAALTAVTFYGKAELGDRTLLDALNPVLGILREKILDVRRDSIFLLCLDKTSKNS